jgi:ATP-binding cassette, subfamily B, bacterial
METNADKTHIQPFRRFIGLLQLEKRNVYYIYFYSIISGLLYISLPLGIQAIISFMFAQQLSSSLLFLIAFVVAGVLVNGYMYILQMRLSERIQTRIFTLMSLAYADRLPKLQEEHINEYHLPETVNRFFDTSAIQKGISKILLDLPAATIQILFGLTLLSFYHPSFILFGIIIILILYLIMRYTSPMGIQTSMEESDFKYKVGYWIEEIARNLNTFKLRGKTDLALTKTNKYVEGYLDARAKHFKILQIQYWTFAVFKTIVTAVLLIAGSYLFFENKINIGQFVATEIVIIMTLSSVEKIIGSLDGFYDLLTSLEKASKLLDKPVEESNTLYHENISHLDINVSNLSFSYPNSEKEVLKNISFSIKQGEKIALIGTKGSGKSTLMHLLTGIYNSHQGSILINNIPLHTHNISLLRSKVGVFFTDSEIFEGTLEENLSVGLENIKFEDILNVASAVELKDFILKNKDSIYQELSTQGKKLPDNIKAKILLCRALLKKPYLLLLDDFRHILIQKDSTIITDYLLNDSQPFSLIIRTSDEEIMKRCDRVFFMHEGKLVADGTFEKISSMGIYQSMSKQLDNTN